MGFKARPRTVRMWVTWGAPDRAELWENRPAWVYGRWFAEPGNISVCVTKIEELGIPRPCSTDQPLLVEFSARVVEDDAIDLAEEGWSYASQLGVMEEE